MVVTLSRAGYVKWQPRDDYETQRRGGKGKSATSMRSEDLVYNLYLCNTHDTVICFSRRGRVYWMKVYEFPQASRAARGKPIVNLLPLQSDEHIQTIVPVRDFEQGGFLFMATANGTVKKTPLEAFSRPRSTGIIALDLVEDDRLVGVAFTDGKQDIMLASNHGKAITFDERDVRAMGRTARGVRGMRLGEGDHVNSLLVVGEGLVLTATEHGYGKCTPPAEYRHTGRGGQGVISIQTSERNGSVVGAQLVNENDDVMLITSGGKLVRTRVAEIRVMGRNTQGVRLISLAEGETLVGMQRVVDEE